MAKTFKPTYFFKIFDTLISARLACGRQHMEAKEMRRGGILCQLDDLADMLLEKLDHDNDLLRR